MPVSAHSRRQNSSTRSSYVEIDKCAQIVSEGFREDHLAYYVDLISDSRRTIHMGDPTSLYYVRYRLPFQIKHWPVENRSTMAKRTITTLVDDIDGSEATTSFTFAFEGTNYEIDLNDANAEKFSEALKPWVGAARKATKTGTSSGGTSRKSAGRKDLAAIRKWAKDNGHEVSDRGRIPANVVEAYDAAH